MSKKEKYRNVFALGILILFIGMSVNPLSVALQDFTQVTGKNNNPPSMPIFLGPTRGIVGEEYSYTINSTDPEGDDVYYIIFWEPGVIYEWFGPYESGEEVTVVHTWDEPGAYPVLARAMDVYDAESEFAILEVVIGEIIYVDDDNTAGPWDGTLEHPYQHIQDGIDAANSGDTVFVFNGTYYENIVVNKSICLIGEDRNQTIIDSGGNGTVVDITVNWVNIMGFTIQNSGDDIYYNAGIYVNADFSVISDNIIVNNKNGIYLDGMSNHMNRNIIRNNDENGIYAWSSYNSIIRGNIIANNVRDGIYFSITSFDNIIYENNIKNNNYGVNLKYTSGNSIYHNNFINNSQNAYSYGINTWDDGYPSGGNYWDDYTGMDANQDGIGDTPYDIPGWRDRDFYPLMMPFGLDIEPPVVVIEYPENGAIFYESNVIVSGYATDNVGIVVGGYGHEWSLGGAGGEGFFPEPLLNWSFEIEIELYPGWNKIWVTASDAAENRGADIINITYIPSFEIYVDDDFNESTPGWGYDHFDSIQDGVDAVAENGTVFVYNGTYYENVIVDKSINLIGENRESTIIDGEKLDHFDVIEIFVDGVMITGFTIKNSGNCWPNDVGIDIRANHTQIIDNIIENNQMGIYLLNSDSNIVCCNIFRDSPERDIRLDYHSDNNTIADNFLESDISIVGGERNKILNNTLQGELRIQWSNNIVRENKLKKGLDINPLVINDVDTSNTINGKTIYYYVNKTGLTVPSDAAEIILVNCHYFTISNHLLLDDAPGIILGLSTYNMITNNVIRNGGDAISLYSSSNNTIIKNDIDDSICGISLLSKSFDNIVDDNHLDGVESEYWIGRGIQVVNSQQNIIVNNIIQNYLEVGIWLYTDSDFNQIYHNNFIDNRINAKDECINSWDNGYPSGGNYWDGYTGEDNNGDGIGDTPYDITGLNNQDFYPLMNPWGENLPIANFTYEIDSATVTFDASSSYDRDGEIATWLWDFGDGVEMAGEIVWHTYSESGTFEVTLTVIDDDGYEGQITKSIEVEAEYEFETALLIGRITNLNTKGEFFTFDSVMVRYITFAPLSLNSYYSGETIAISQDYIGLVGARFIFALCSASFGMSPPTILFSQADQSATNTLTVISADPADMVWSDFDLQVDGIASAHGMSGTVTAGDIIDITAIAGTGAYTISLRHIPTNTLIGSWDFT